VKKTSQNLEPFAGIGIAYPCREEAEAEDQHDDVQHDMLLAARLFQGARIAGKTDRNGTYADRTAIRGLTRISGG
jgi:hypothetical protein